MHELQKIQKNINEKIKHILNPLNNWIFFSCDHLEFTINDIKKDTYLNKYWIIPNWDLDLDNSSVSYCTLYDHIFLYRKAKAKWWQDLLIFTTTIDNIPVDCFAFVKWKDIFKGKQKSKDKIVFYSTFFVLEKMNKLDFTLSEFFQSLFPINCKLHRMDICLDLPNTIKQLQNSVFKNTKFFSRIWEDKKHPEFSQTYYIKNPRSSENRSYIIRIYDKVLDTFKKKKQFLYPHLKKNLDVRRVELELRTKECQLYHDDFTIVDILENKERLLEKVFCKYLNKNILDPFLLSEEAIKCNKHYNHVTDLKAEYLRLWHIPNNYISRSHGYIKSIQTSIWYEGLFDMLFNIKKDTFETIRTQTTSYQAEICKKHGYNIDRIITHKTNNIINSYDFFENLIIYMQKNLLSERKINQIIKKHIKSEKTILKLKK